MILTNETNLNTKTLKVFLYSLSKAARISTSKVKTTIKYGKNLHGLCNSDTKTLTVWITPNTKAAHFGHVWVHELAHLKDRNIRLYMRHHPQLAQRMADQIAYKVTGIRHEDVDWNGWRARRWTWTQDKKVAELHVDDFNKKYLTREYRMVPSTHLGKKGWVIEGRDKISGN